MSTIHCINTSPSTSQTSPRSSQQCQICGASALYSNFGAITCGACKVFFRRAAGKGQKQFECHWSGNCEINLNTRHACSACRLKKCFTHGMQTEMIRASLSKSSSIKRNKKINTGSNIVVTNILISPLNLLQTDQSTLSRDQWNRISDLIHCYDEHGALTMTEQFISKENAFPIKLRYKPENLTEMYKSLLTKTAIFENNLDTLSVCLEDRSTLIHSAVKLVSALGGSLILHQTKLMHNDVFYTSNVTLFGSDCMSLSKKITSLMDDDLGFMKLIMAALSFSTWNYAVFRKNTVPRNIKDIKAVLRIQDKYIELAWKYMTYKYGSEHTVRRFNQLLRCLFCFQEGNVEADKYQIYGDILDVVSERVEQLLVTCHY